MAAEDYKGSVGHEKKDHKSHFTVPEMPWKKDKKTPKGSKPK